MFESSDIRVGAHRLQVASNFSVKYACFALVFAKGLRCKDLPSLSLGSGAASRLLAVLEIKLEPDLHCCRFSYESCVLLRDYCSR